MALTFTSLDDLTNHGFDTLIDVRSPAEFAEDHIPGAINLPSLSNDERAEVGTIYKQVSPFKARKIGAALVLNNIATHVAGPLKDKDGSWRPLVYCWRGGQRSGVFGTILKEVGWRADTIAGGYQTYRRMVNRSLYEDRLPHRLFLLDGYTGTAKTALLGLLSQQDVQVIDLEDLAGHRGSLLGERPGGQPSQRMFETELTQALGRCDPDKPTLLEAESSKIGRLNLPPSLWKAMVDAPRIQLTAPMAARVKFIASAYQEILADPETVKTRLAPLRRVRGHAIVDQWQTLQDGADLEALACALMEDHYDPSYATARRKHEHRVIETVHAETLDTCGLDKAAAHITTLVKRL